MVAGPASGPTSEQLAAQSSISAGVVCIMRLG